MTLYETCTLSQLLLSSLLLAAPDFGPPYVFLTKGLGSKSALRLADSSSPLVSDIVLMDPVDANAKWEITSRLHNWTETGEFVTAISVVIVIFYFIFGDLNEKYSVPTVVHTFVV